MFPATLLRELEPAFPPDGKTVVFSTERYTTSLATLEPGPLRLAALDLATGVVRPITAFLKGKHVSPQVSLDGTSVYFVADPDGISNVYRVSSNGGAPERITNVSTGVAGITEASPALTVGKAQLAQRIARASDRITRFTIEHR